MKEKDTAFVEYQRNKDVLSVKQSFKTYLKYMQVKDKYSATTHDYYLALAGSVWDRIVERWIETAQRYYKEDRKRVYYLSLEFLMGRYITNNMINLQMRDICKNAVEDLGLDISVLEEMENDPGLGNGGLGRLAACFLDSMTTLDIAGYGYGIRYQYGIFRQRIKNGCQIEEPDDWLKYGYPWEIARPEYTQEVNFYGDVETYSDEKGTHFRWVNTQKILAVPYDTPIVGWRGERVNTLRLWSATASKEFDLSIFNHGDYIKAVEDKNASELISKVLYPNDLVLSGKELRLKQEYFFVSASLQDILRRFKKVHSDFRKLPEKVSIQLNDTHPSLVIPELMRLLMDVEGLPWEDAWDITVKTCHYTNHTIMPEALEKWPVHLISNLLPRHMQIIYEINWRFLQEVAEKYPNDIGRLSRLSLIEEGPVKHVRMANLAIVGSSKVNGVARLHTSILKNYVFKEFAEIYPDKFVNVTNGVTQRRWLVLANPELTEFITDRIGDGFITDLSKLKKLESFASDTGALKALMDIKASNKKRLAEYIKKSTGIEVDPSSIFDIQVKRFHEYKRQSLNIMHIIMLYNRLLKDPNYGMYPRTFIFAGKSAPGYYLAKLIIRLINAVASKVNNDPAIKNKLKVVFLENYSVSLAEKIIPAADVSEQISTAGKEASGTGCMKFALNGAITIGTMDGANIEIREEVGDDNIFIFGLTSEEIEAHRRNKTYNPWNVFNKNPEVKQMMEQIRDGYFNPHDPGLFRPLFDTIMGSDEFFVLADIEAYAEAQQKIDQAYRERLGWAKKSLYNIARVGKFSSDRSIIEYARNIWSIPYDQQQ